MIGETLKRVRIENRYTNKCLSELSGVNPATITRIEKGQMSPTVKILEKLASAMGKDVSIFFADKHEYKQVSKEVS